MSITIPIEKLPVSTWQFNNKESDISYPVIINEIAYFGSSVDVSRESIEHHTLCAVNVHTGEEIWQVLNAGWSLATPTVVDGIIYSGSHDSYLYALDAKTGQVLWRFKTDGRIKATPVVCEGVVYFGSTDYYFYAVDAQTGIEKWRFKTERKIETQATIANGLVCLGISNLCIYIFDAITGEQKYSYFGLMPMLINSVLYLGRGDNVYAIDIHTGEQKWCAQVGLLKHSPVVLDGTVFCVNRNGIYALDESTGAQKWCYPCKVYERPVFVDNLIYIGNYTNSEHVHVINVQTGVEEWSFIGSKRQHMFAINTMVYMFSSEGSCSYFDLANTDLQQEIECQRLKKAQYWYATKWKVTIQNYKSLPVLSDGLLYCVSTNVVNDYSIYALDAQTGKDQWQFKAAGGVYIKPVIHDGMVYFLSYKKNVFYALDAKTGLEKWKFKSKDMVSHTKFTYSKPYTACPLVADGVVYVSCGHKYVFALDCKTGAEKWRFKPDDYALLTPIIVGDLIFIASFKGDTIYAIDIKTGVSKWHFSLKKYSGSIGSWIITDDVLYIVYEIYNKPAQLYALDIQKMEQGLTLVETLLWNIELMGLRPPLVTNGKFLYHINTKEHALSALDYKTGTERWKFAFTRSRRCKFTINSNEEMYVADGHSIYLLDNQTGEIITEWETEVEIATNFIKTENNIYFFDDGDQLTAYGNLTALELACE